MTIARRLPTLVMPAKRASTSSAASVAKRPRLDLAPISPFTVDALKQALIDADPSTDGKEPRLVDLLELELTKMDPTWLKALHNELRQDYFADLKRFLWRSGLRAHDIPSLQLFPAASNIYAWSRHTPLDKVRVVILGQDPYHNVGQAHGLAFSVRHGVAVPPSLRNMHKELATEYPDFKPPKHGNLEAWAKSGVLLLNASLTVKAHEAASHAGKGWEEFTSAAVRAVDEQTEGVVFLAWGKPAEKGVAKVDRKKHLVLTSAHPSPLSASRGFFGNGHFIKANDWLRERYGEQGTIDWTNLDGVQAQASSLHPIGGEEARTESRLTVTEVKLSKSITGDGKVIEEVEETVVETKV